MTRYVFKARQLEILLGSGPEACVGGGEDGKQSGRLTMDRVVLLVPV